MGDYGRGKSQGGYDNRSDEYNAGARAKREQERVDKQHADYARRQKQDEANRAQQEANRKAAKVHLANMTKTDTLSSGSGSGNKIHRPAVQPAGERETSWPSYIGRGAMTGAVLVFLYWWLVVLNGNLRISTPLMSAVLSGALIGGAIGLGIVLLKVAAKLAVLVLPWVIGIAVLLWLGGYLHF